jgi:hypothetical protein
MRINVTSVLVDDQDKALRLRSSRTTRPGPSVSPTSEGCFAAFASSADCASRLAPWESSPRQSR